MNPEIKPQDQQNAPVAQQQQLPVENNTETQNKQQEAETSKDINWKAFKAAREAERKQAEEIAKQAKKSQEEAAALKAALEAALNRPQPQMYDNGLQNEETEEQRIEKKVNELLAKKEAEYEKRRQEEEQRTWPRRISEDFKDFDQVCSVENLDYLDYHYPEIAKAYAHMPQGYDRWACIYKSVKRFIPNADSKKDASKADKNFNKPQSASGVGMTNSGDGKVNFKLDEQRKAENWARMQKALKTV